MLFIFQYRYDIIENRFNIEECHEIEGKKIRSRTRRWSVIMMYWWSSEVSSQKESIVISTF